MPALPPIVCFVAPSGTGKSTAIVRLLPVLAARGLRVGVIKHDAHRVSFDAPGKDTWRFRQAGAYRAVIAGDHEVALFAAPGPGPATPAALAEAFLGDADLVLAEGYRTSGLPCVRVYRRDGPRIDAWTPPPEVIAWFADEPIPGGVPVVPLDDAEAQADFLLGWLRTRP